MASLTGEKKPRMRTADEIFARLKYDEQCPYPPDNVTIGYEDRFLGIMEITIAAFEDPEAEIPFHRIRYFRTTDTNHIFWDRRRRIDLLTAGFQGGDADLTTSTNSTEGHRSGSKKKKKIQAKRREKREDVKVQLVEEIVTEESVENAQAGQLPLTLEQVQRQQQRLQREQRRIRREAEKKAWLERFPNSKQPNSGTSSGSGSNSASESDSGSASEAEDVADDDVALFADD